MFQVKESSAFLCMLFSRFQLFATPWTAAHQAFLSFTISQSLLKLIAHWVGDAIQSSHPLLLPSPAAFNLSQHQGFANESEKVAPCSRLPKYWIFCFSISPSNEYSGLTSICRKRQESGLTEIIPFKGLSARWGQFPVFYTFWGSLRLQSDDGESQVFFPFLSALRAQKLTFEGCHRWCLRSPCLLIGQEILLFSISYS